MTVSARAARGGPTSRDNLCHHKKPGSLKAFNGCGRLARGRRVPARLSSLRTDPAANRG